MTMWIENAVENDEADVEQRNHVNFQVTDSVGGSKPCKIFHLGGNAFSTLCRYVPVRS